MTDNDKVNPQAIQFYVPKVLLEQENAAILVRMALNPESYKTIVNFEGHKMYEAAVRAVYNAFCLLDTQGVDSIDIREIKSFKKGMEDYLVPRKK